MRIGEAEPNLIIHLDRAQAKSVLMQFPAVS
jgi:hypothetical protein